MDPHSLRKKGTKWPPEQHNAYHAHKAEDYRKKKRKRKATLEMQKRERALR